MRSARHLSIVAWPAIIALAGSVAVAQKAPDPEVGYIDPAGAARGQTAIVQLAGFDWTPDLEFFVLDPRVTMTTEGTLSRHLMPEPPFPIGMRAYRPYPIPREITARIELPADLPRGPIRWQVANANGTSNTGVFFVGDGPEVVESRDGDELQALDQLPVTVSGRLARYEEVDGYLITPPADGLVTCDLWARRLGAPFNGALEVRDEADQLVVDAVDSQGMDVSVTWSARAGAQYRVLVRDLNFRGNRACVYRLEVSTGPRVLAAMPAAGFRGATREVELIGYGLGSGECRLERVTRTVTFPDDPQRATFAWEGETGAGWPVEFTFPLSDVPESVASPAAANEVMQLSAPTAITGLLDRERPSRRFRFSGTKGETYRIDAQARRLGSPLDVALAIVGPDGQELAAVDDLPGTTDAGLEFTVPEDGAYEVVVSDLSVARPAPLHLYRLVVQRPEPGFRTEVPQQMSVPIGDTTELTLKATRAGGFDGPITIAVSGLPTGIEIPGELVIAGDQSEFKIPLTSSENAPSGASLVIITGTAEIGERMVQRRAVAQAAGNLAPRDPADLAVESVLIASTMKPVVKIRPIETDERTVHRGTMHLAELAIEREPGFAGEVVVQMDSRQPVKFRQGIIGPDVIVPAGDDRVFYPCLVPHYAEMLDAYRFLLEAVAQVPDPGGRTRHLVSKMQADDASVAITVEGALLQISSASFDVPARPGTTVRLPVSIARSAKLEGPVMLEVRGSSALSDSIRAEPIEVAAGQTEVMLPVELDGDLSSSDQATLTIRALALQSGRPPVLSDRAQATPMDPELMTVLESGVLPVIAETTVTLDFAAAEAGGG